MNLHRLNSVLPAGGLIFILVILVVLAWLFTGPDIVSSLTEALILMVMVVGMSIFISNSGVVSFGHISFAVIGAYASAWQTCCPGLRGVYMPGLPTELLNINVPVALAALIAAALSAVFATLVGMAIMRLSGVAASIALLSLLFVVKTAYENWDSVTAGQSSLVGLPLYVNVWVALGVASGAIVIAQIFANSSIGLRLRAVREDEVAARAMGVRAWGLRLLAFALSAFVVALGGILYGHYLGTLAVNMFWLDMTFVTLSMLVVGGLRSLTGAVVGVLAVTIVRDFLRILERGVDIWGHQFNAPEGIQEIGLAIVLLLVLIYRPAGLVGDRELGVARPG